MHFGKKGMVMESPEVVEILTKLGIDASGGVLSLIAIIPFVVARLKSYPVLESLQGKGYPAYEVTAVVLGVLGSLAMGVSNPVVTGIVFGLAGIGGRQIAKSKGDKK
jgi:hypothetical protein